MINLKSIILKPNINRSEGKGGKQVRIAVKTDKTIAQIKGRV